MCKMLTDCMEYSMKTENKIGMYGFRMTILYQEPMVEADLRCTLADMANLPGPPS